MPIKSEPKYVKLKVALMIIVAGGLIWAEMGQKSGSCRGLPDIGERYVFAIVPYALLAIGLLLLARSRADLIVLVVCAVMVVILNVGLLGIPDELGLACPFVAIEGILLVIPVLVVVMIRRLVARWLKRRKVNAPLRSP